MQIGEISERLGLSAYTLRYYEKIGIIPPVKRDRHGLRDYSEADYEWIAFIQCMKNSGMNIQTLMQYARLWEEGTDTVEVKKQLLHKQQKLLTAKLSIMKRLETALSDG